MKKYMMAAVVAVGLMFSVQPAMAYYDTVDNPEYIEIMPNESAFAIPEVGANKTSQTAFMSEAYLNEQVCDANGANCHGKIALKRFQVPHVLIKTSALSKDYYVPATKLLLVDRTPYNAEWTDDADTGTSKYKQAIHFESGQSADARINVSIAAHVTEENAAKFAYYYGAKNVGTKDSNDPATTFASVIRGRSLTDIMDSNVRGKVQTCVAREFGKLATDDLLTKKDLVSNTCEKEVKDFFANYGITIDYVGFSSGITWGNSKIQTAMDEAYIAQKNAQAYDARVKMVNVTALEADVAIKNSQAAAINNVSSRWNGSLNLPNWFVMPESMSGVIGKFIGGAVPAAK